MTANTGVYQRLGPAAKISLPLDDYRQIARKYGNTDASYAIIGLITRVQETAAERDRLREINAELREAAQNLIEFLEKSVNAGPISNKPKPERLLLACLRAAIAKATEAAA